MGFGRWALRDTYGIREVYSKGRTTVTTTLTAITTSDGFNSVQFTSSNGKITGVLQQIGLSDLTLRPTYLPINLNDNIYNTVRSVTYSDVFGIDTIISSGLNYVYSISNDQGTSVQSVITLYRDDGSNGLTLVSKTDDTGRDFGIAVVTLNNTAYAFFLPSPIPSTNTRQGAQITWNTSGGALTGWSSYTNLTFSSFPAVNRIRYANGFSTHILFGYASSLTTVELGSLSGTTITYRSAKTTIGNVTRIRNDGTYYYVVTTSGYIYRYTINSTPSISAEDSFQVSTTNNSLQDVIKAGDFICCTSVDGYLYIIPSDNFNSSNVIKRQILDSGAATTRLQGLLYDSTNNYLLIPSNRTNRIFYFNLTLMQQEQ
jgi:hypothetical protein